MKTSLGLLIIILSFLVCSCSSSSHATKNTSGNYVTQSGKASYYSDNLAGHKTANGEKYRPSDYTAAHKKLPFGTKVIVTNTANGKSVTVRINDRGPFVAGRIIDVSKAAAKDLGLISVGVTNVKIKYKKL